MRKLLLPLAVLAAAPLTTAQNCFDGDLGTQIGGGTATQDWVSPIQTIGFNFPVAGTNYANIHVSDHGLCFLSNAGTPPPPLTGDPILYTPSTTNFSNGSPKVCCLYTDVISVAASTIWFKSTASRCIVTWLNMQNFGIPANTWSMQMILSPNGDVRCIYGVGATNASTFGGVSDNGIVGISAGGGVALPPVVDLSAGGATATTTIFENWVTANTFDMANNTLFLAAASPGYAYVTLGAPANCGSIGTNGTGCAGLAMGAAYVGGSTTTTSVFPSIGNSGLTLRITGITIPVAFVAFGTAPLPGIPLGGIGMTGCNAYTNFDIGLFSSGPVAGGQSDFLLALPPNPAIVGATLATQGVALTLANPANLAASGGVNITVGAGP